MVGNKKKVRVWVRKATFLNQGVHRTQFIELVCAHLFCCFFCSSSSFSSFCSLCLFCSSSILLLLPILLVILILFGLFCCQTAIYRWIYSYISTDLKSMLAKVFTAWICRCSILLNKLLILEFYFLQLTSLQRSSIFVTGLL